MTTGTTGSDTTGVDIIRVNFIDTAGTLISASNLVFATRRVFILAPSRVEPARQMFRDLGQFDVDVYSTLPIPVVAADFNRGLPALVTGWLSPTNCGLHGARVQRRLHRAGGARWRVRTVEVRRRQPGARETRRRPLAAIVKQVRKAMRRMARGEA